MKIIPSNNHKLIEEIFNYKINNLNPFSKLLIASIEETNECIGFLVYTVIYERMEIDMIMVSDKHRRKKVGTSLIDYLLKEAKEQKTENITLEVNINNEAAIKLYNKKGFERKAIREKYYNNEDGILMLKEVK